MKTGVSVPDHIFREAERIARRSKKSRSRLFTEALEEYVARHAGDAVTEAMNRVCDAVGSEEKSDFVSSAARRILERVEW